VVSATANTCVVTTVLVVDVRFSWIRRRAPPVAGDGKVYIVSQSGVVAVLDAARGQEVLSTGELDDEVYATPAIAGGRIFIRTRSALCCFGS
jgi:outer membrane protein assembly factor BamB